MTTSERAQCVALHCEKKQSDDRGASKRPVRYVRCGFSPEMVAQVENQCARKTRRARNGGGEHPEMERGAEKGRCRRCGCAFHDIGVEPLAVLEVVYMLLYGGMAVVLVGYDRVGEHYDECQHAEAQRKCLIPPHPHKDNDNSGFFM